MAGSLIFDTNNGVISLGSSFIDIIADYLKPYISEAGEEIVNQVYEVYNVFNFLKFNNLTPEDYMQCYKQIKKALIEDIQKNKETKKYSPEWYQWLEEEWEEEIKPKMEQSPLFRKELL